MAVAALLHPKVAHAQLFAEPLGPEEVGVALKHAHNVVVINSLHARTKSGIY